LNLAKGRFAPEPPRRRLHLGVTGHRANHPGFDAQAASISAALSQIFDVVDQALASLPAVAGAGTVAPTRLHALLADGTDGMAADMALTRGYELVAPLPFGRRLNKAINALPASAADARLLMAGNEASDPLTQLRADGIRRLSDQATLISLADQDESIAQLFLDKLDHPADAPKAQRFAAEASRRVATAGRILIEQSDILVAVWDGVSTAHVGGTGHTIEAALNVGSPVVWIDTANPVDWRILIGPEALIGTAAEDPATRPRKLGDLVQSFLSPRSAPGHPGLATLTCERWRPRSNRLAHAYRRIETLFGGQSDRSRLRSLVQHYASPEDRKQIQSDALIAATLGLPSGDPRLGEAIADEVAVRFRWTDGISAYLSDTYRGGMIVNFILSSLAIVVGVAYLPLVPPDQKWKFAVIELLLLCAILAITALGQRKRWHGRWFETRRLAEYLRHSAILLALGSARAPGRWPIGTETSWPEFYARQTLRSVGLPQAVITTSYLRSVLTRLLDPHVTGQRDYHFEKARRLTTVHRNLDGLSERLFQLGVASVCLYLLLFAGVGLGFLAEEPVALTSKGFTVLGVLFPTFGAGIAGIRYFGDFERFAAISEVTAEKLDRVHARILRLAAAPDVALHYDSVADIAHAADDIVFAEIENWQAVFGSKQIAVPV
jgi:hypothetical protein